MRVWIYQLVGFAAMVLGFLIFQQTDRKKMILIKLACDILWVTHFALIGAYSGMAISCVGCLREIIFYHKKENSKKGVFLLTLFLLLGITGVILTWNSIWCICSLISTILSTTAYWQNKTVPMKILLFMTSVSQIIYAIHFVSYSAIANEIITMLSLLIFLFRTLAQKAGSDSMKNAKIKKINTKEKL